MSAVRHPALSRPLTAVLAVGRNGAIGRAGRLPWTLPSDLARFRTLTWGKPMIMGRRTFESIGRALPGRESIVVSRSPDLALPAGAHLVTSLDDALALADRRAAAMGATEATVIGGASLLAAAMPSLDRIHLTIVDLCPTADTFFEPLDPYEWREVARHKPARRDGDDADCVVLTYERA